MTSYELEVFADYFQFYLWDAGTDPSAPEEWTQEDIDRRVKVAPHVVVIEPVRNTTVLVTIRIRSGDPTYDTVGWDHIVECSLELSTGHLQVHECTGGPVLDVEMPPATYRLRVFFANLDSLSDNGLEGDDHYVVEIWPGQAQDLRVVKDWNAHCAG